MWCYFGNKTQLTKHHYPKPIYDKIIEPFAGTAKYSLKYFEKDIMIVDKYKILIDVWLYLQTASESDILKLPALKRGQSINDYKELSEVEKNFLGFLVCQGLESPRMNVGNFQGVNVGRDLKRIAKTLYKIRHWKIMLGSYEDIENIEATYFIDPPYMVGGEYYVENNKNINYKHLAEWCKSRQGQVIVCENTKATWLDFKAIKQQKGSNNKKTTEAIWTNFKTAYHNEQQKLDM